MRKYIGSLLLGAALLVPFASQAQNRNGRYYDRDRRDYHEWNNGETRAYQRWQEENRDQRRREFRRESRQRQLEYWRWRHNHSDSILFPR